MSIFLGKKVTTDDTPEEKFRRYLRQRQRREALQIHGSSIQQNNRQVDTTEKVIKSYRLMTAILSGQSNPTY
jgi:hypothetical protein